MDDETTNSQKSQNEQQKTKRKQKKSEEISNSDTMQNNEKVDETSSGGEKDAKEPNTADSGRRASHKLKHGLALYWSKKKLSLPLSLAVLLLIILALPVTRYDVLGLVAKRNVTVVVIDSTTQRPVSDVAVTIGSKTLNTDAAGRASGTVKLGHMTLRTSKEYYQDRSSGEVVTLSSHHNTFRVEIVATGRQVPVTVKNKISGKPVANITLDVLRTKAITDKNGKAIIVLPVGSKTQTGQLSGEGYNHQEVTVTVTDRVVSSNDFKIVPAGKVYFLSNLSGKVDLVKANLDGTDRKTIIAGNDNGQYVGNNVYLSTDGRYAAYFTSRSDGYGGEIKLVDTSTDKVVGIDEGDKVDFEGIGWSGHYFIYKVLRTAVRNWQPNAASIKSFNADTKHIIALDNTNGSGTSTGNALYYSYNPSPVLLGDRVVFATEWTGSWYNDPRLLSKRNQLVSIKADGSDRKVVMAVVPPNSRFGGIRRDKPQRIVFMTNNFSKNIQTYYTLSKSGDYQKTTDYTGYELYSTNIPDYISSPSHQHVVWSEDQDGRIAIYVGDDQGKNEKQLVSSQSMYPAGWLNDDYILLTKGGELYIINSAGGTKPVKVVNFYAPPVYRYNQ